MAQSMHFIKVYERKKRIKILFKEQFLIIFLFEVKESIKEFIDNERNNKT